MTQQSPLRDAALQSLDRQIKKIDDNSASPFAPSAGAVQILQSLYVTAGNVQRQRSMIDVERRCLEEAAIAGDGFYYTWKQGGKVIEGLTVWASHAVARNMGNCVVNAPVIGETPDAWYFMGHFGDLETGYNIVRPFRQNKRSPKKKDGTEIYEGDRALDVLFQIGASKAIRNAVLNAAPVWLLEAMMNKAKENVVSKIEKMGPVKAKEMIVAKAGALGVAIARIEGVYGAKWDTKDMVMISSALRAIEDGFETSDTVFPKPVEAKVNETKAEPASNSGDGGQAGQPEGQKSVRKGKGAGAKASGQKQPEQPSGQSAGKAESGREQQPGSAGVPQGGSGGEQPAPSAPPAVFGEITGKQASTFESFEKKIAKINTSKGIAFVESQIDEAYKAKDLADTHVKSLMTSLKLRSDELAKQQSENQ